MLVSPLARSATATVFGRTSLHVATNRHVHISSLLLNDKQPQNGNNTVEDDNKPKTPENNKQEQEKSQPQEQEQQPSLAEAYLDIAAPEKSSSSTSSSVSILDSDASSSGSGKRGGGRSSKQNYTSVQLKRKMYSRIFMSSSVVGALMGLWWLGRDWETEREVNELSKQVDSSAEGLRARYLRTNARFWDMLDYFNKPAWDPLLPPTPPNNPFTHTLVLELDDVLVHSDWDVKHGWRIAKRPGLDYFISYLSQFYEIVIFTNQPHYTADPIIDKIDPFRAYIPYRLYRESTRYKSGAHIKDLSYLGRNPSRVIVVDSDRAAVQLDPDNAAVLPPWKGDKKDRDLIEMIPFLEAIAFQNVPDVRPILRKYKDKHVPTEYAKAEAESRKLLVESWKEKEEKRKERGGDWFQGWSLASLLGISESENAPPKTQLDIMRERAQIMYVAQQKLIKENEGQWLKEREAEEAKMREQSKGSLVDLLTGRVGPQAQQAEETAVEAAAAASSK